MQIESATNLESGEPMATATMPVNLPVELTTREPVPNHDFASEKAFAAKLVRQATELLESHPHFRGRCHRVFCQYSGGNLLLLGVVPSYYLKQLAQEALRQMGGTRQIVNRLRVVDPRHFGGPKSETTVSSILRWSKLERMVN